MMAYDEIPATMRAFVGTFETLRGFGFPASALFLETGHSVRAGLALSAFCTIAHHGRRFRVELGRIEGDEEAFCALYYRIAAEGKAAFSARDIFRMRDESEAFRMKASLLMALIDRGLYPVVTS